jgi:hypothetical protein
MVYLCVCMSVKQTYSALYVCLHILYIYTATVSDKKRKRRLMLVETLSVVFTLRGPDANKYAPPNTLQLMVRRVRYTYITLVWCVIYIYVCVRCICSHVPIQHAYAHTQVEKLVSRDETKQTPVCVWVHACVHVCECMHVYEYLYVYTNMHAFNTYTHTGPSSVRG